MPLRLEDCSPNAIKQFVPSDFCLKCLGCCRFAENPTIWAPAGCELLKNNEGYRCSYLKEADNRCAIYNQRPLDCQLYPFLLVKRDNTLSLGLHKSCLYIEEKRKSAADLQKYTQYLKKILRTPAFMEFFKNNPDSAAKYQDNLEIFSRLILTHNARPEASRPYLLQKLTIKDKQRLSHYLKKSSATLSVYHFAPLFIWKGLFKIWWVVIDECLCLFYQDNIGMFMIIPPLGKFNPQTIKKVFGIMHSYNQNKEISRIENVEEKELAFYRSLALKPKLKEAEYLCLRKNLVSLEGFVYKHKRSSYNHFVKHYRPALMKYQASMFFECLELYRLWIEERKLNHGDVIYQQMLEDSRVSFKTALRYYRRIGLLGYVVKVDGKIKACSFGYPLNKEVFCILFEPCDLSLKGIAQFIFREFCRQLKGYKYINIMGASDLENLKKVKLSYRPIKEAKVYTIYE